MRMSRAAREARLDLDLAATGLCTGAGRVLSAVAEMIGFSSVGNAG